MPNHLTEPGSDRGRGLSYWMMWIAMGMRGDWRTVIVAGSASATVLMLKMLE